jgi:hypothetical protein
MDAAIATPLAVTVTPHGTTTAGAVFASLIMDVCPALEAPRITGMTDRARSTW